MRGAIYSRVSTEIQDYGKQTDELKDYAARNNIEVKYIFDIFCRKFLFFLCRCRSGRQQIFWKEIVLQAH